MSEEIVRFEPSQPLFWPVGPGYFATKRGLARLHYFQEFIRRLERVHHNLDLASAIEQVVIEFVSPGDNRNYIDQEIPRLMRLVQRDLKVAGVITKRYRLDWHYVRKITIRTDFDIIMDYFCLPYNEHSRSAFYSIMLTLDQGIGIYESRLKLAKLEIFNPRMWMVYLTRLPIMIIEGAGLMGHRLAEFILKATRVHPQ
jgi:hypothetical protein